MNRRLPSLTALRAFDSAARHLNFTHASEELGVGQPAISRQISRLETELGTPLFVRRPTVTLTEAGRRLHEVTKKGFSSIASVVAEISSASRSREITLDVSIGFAAFWLLARFADFSARHPDIAVRLVTRDLTDVANPLADIVVYHGRRERAADAQRLFPELIVPVCAADYPETDRPMSPSELLHAPLLGLSERAHGDAWHRLFEGTDLSAPPIPPGRHFTSFIVYRQAILQHQGIGIAWRGLMDDDFDAGLLVPVTDLVYTDHDGGYWVTTTRPGEGADVFRSWLLDAAA